MSDPCHRAIAASGATARLETRTTDERAGAPGLLGTDELEVSSAFRGSSTSESAFLLARACLRWSFSQGKRINMTITRDLLFVQRFPLASLARFASHICSN
mmetsp:Transcript_94642/g.289528  ORF Transcript_94642/g.289528 Transcript_94642/m.289528 type:complete len:101 (+) Transcript_94642:26-328(+)